METGNSMSKNVWLKNEVILHSRTLLHSYHFYTGLQLFPQSNDAKQLAEALYHAPFIVLSHGIEKDPIFNYANLAAQKLWKLDWEEFTTMPSRLSAEPIEESRRNVLLEEGRKKGVTHLKEGIRVDKTGRKFYIRDVVLFNLINENHHYMGQGAIYDKWEYK